MDDVPVLLLDVDGVLNASRPGWGGPGQARHVDVRGCELRLRWEPQAVACVRMLHMAGIVEVRWATSWLPDVDVLETLWQLPTLGRAWAGLAHDAWEAKVDAALSVLATGRRLVWTDDDLNLDELPPEIGDAEKAGRALLIAPRSSRGLRPEDFHRIEQWARREG